MTINFIGDCYTMGQGAMDPWNDGFVNLVGKKLNCKVNKYGAAFCKISRNKEMSYPHKLDMDLNVWYELIDKNADYVFVFIGTNDYRDGSAPLGDISDKDVYTFCGAINTYIDRLEKDFGSNFAFIIPFKLLESEKIFNGEKRVMRDYVNKLKEVLSLRKVPYIDLFNEMPAPVKDEHHGLYYNGYFPNEEGHVFIADKVCEFIKNNGIIK